MKTTKIDLQKHLFQNALIFTGRDRGREVRKNSDINKIEIENDKIIIQIPHNIITISPSFLEEFFYDVVKKLGKDNFFAKFDFENPGEYKIEKNLQTAIKRILRTGNALK
jgi:hypothetical protein